MQITRSRNQTSPRLVPIHRCHVAIVASPDTVLLVLVEPSAEALRARLARYCHEQAPDKLWPRDARELERLFGLGELERATRLYFDRVGSRWDREFLHREVVVSHYHW